MIAMIKQFKIRLSKTTNTIWVIDYQCLNNEVAISYIVYL